MFDVLLHNATLRTMAATAPDADAVAITGGKIAAVGATADLSNATSPATRRIDLGGRTLLPGFNDAHVHVWKVGQLLTTVADLRGAGGFAAIGEALRRQPTGGWLHGRGVNELRLAEGRLPTRHDLDAIVADRPVLLIRTCGHVAIANSRALELAGIGIDSKPPAGGEIHREDDGSPNGIFTETAMTLVQRAMPKPTPSDYEAMIAAAIDHQLRLGITAATDPGVDDTLLGAYQQMDAEDRLPGRYNVMRFPEGVDGPPATATDHLRIDTVKFFMDGGLSGATAALTRPYRHADTTGVLRLTTDDPARTGGAACPAGLADRDACDRRRGHRCGNRSVRAAATRGLAAPTRTPGPADPTSTLSVSRDWGLASTLRRRFSCHSSGQTSTSTCLLTSTSARILSTQ